MATSIRILKGIYITNNIYLLVSDSERTQMATRGTWLWCLPSWVLAGTHCALCWYDAATDAKSLKHTAGHVQ